MMYGNTIAEIVIYCPVSLGPLSPSEPCKRVEYSHIGVNKDSAGEGEGEEEESE